MARKEYAMYKGDKLLAVGTSREIAKELGIKQKTVWWYLSPSYQKRRKSGKNRQELIRLDDKEE